MNYINNIFCETMKKWTCVWLLVSLSVVLCYGDEPFDVLAGLGKDPVKGEPVKTGPQDLPQSQTELTNPKFDYNEVDTESLHGEQDAGGGRTVGSESDSTFVGTQSPAAGVKTPADKDTEQVLGDPNYKTNNGAQNASAGKSGVGVLSQLLDLTSSSKDTELNDPPFDSPTHDEKDTLSRSSEFSDDGFPEKSDTKDTMGKENILKTLDSWQDAAGHNRADSESMSILGVTPDPVGDLSYNTDKDHAQKVRMNKDLGVLGSLANSNANYADGTELTNTTMKNHTMNHHPSDNSDQDAQKVGMNKDLGVLSRLANSSANYADRTEHSVMKNHMMNHRPSYNTDQDTQKEETSNGDQSRDAAGFKPGNGRMLKDIETLADDSNESRPPWPAADRNQQVGDADIQQVGGSDVDDNEDIEPKGSMEGLHDNDGDEYDDYRKEDADHGYRGEDDDDDYSNKDYDRERFIGGDVHQNSPSSSVFGDGNRDSSQSWADEMGGGPDGDDLSSSTRGYGGYYDEDVDKFYYHPDEEGNKDIHTALNPTTEKPHSNDGDSKQQGSYSQIAAPDFKEGVISVEDVLTKKNLQAPKGTIVLYTAMIIIVITGIVIFSIWKNPFKKNGRSSHSTGPVRNIEEGKRLLDHPFV